MFMLSSVTDRLTRLREEFRGEKTYRDKPVLSAEVPRLLTEAYQMYEADAVIIKRAKALKHICDNMTILVRPDELVVGNVAPAGRACVLWLENGADWLWDELESGVFENRGLDTEGHSITKEDKEYLLGIKDYWEPRSVSARIHATAPDGLASTYGSGVLLYHGKQMANDPTGHFCANYNKAITKGFKAIRDEARTKMAELEGCIQGDDGHRYLFYKSIVIVCDVCIDFPKRYAAECRRIAATADETRKEELLRMADSLDWILENPCRTYAEAIQAMFLYHIIMCIDSNMHALTFGRVDQYMWPFLEKDLREGRITESEAQEWMDCLCLKISDASRLWSEGSAKNSGGYSTNQHMTLGGQTREGKDATNPVSFMMLQSVARLILRDPPLSVRVHRNTPAALWEAGLLTSSIVGGIPVFENDEVLIPAFMDRGVPYEDAIDYCIIGCVEPAITGAEWPACGGSGKESYVNFANCALLAINNGVNPLTGIQAGLPTGYLYEMKTFDEVLDAVKRQMAYFLRWHMTMTNMYEIESAELHPLPIVSATMDGCMETGKDVTCGGAKYNSTGVSGIGTANIADSLAAIKYMVFDRKECTARELHDALMANWEGFEPLRQKILNDVPHYGNDDDYVDQFARWATSLYADIVNATRTPRGYFKAGLYPVSCHILFGHMTAATPDGRFSGEALADGISPKQGADRNGPAAILKSVGKLDTIKFRNGTLLNMKFHPKVLEGEGNRTGKLKNLIQAYFDMKGMHVQFNVVSSDTLRAAQENPEEYKNLVIRIAGFSAYFVELYKELQDDLIRRNELAV
jgi:formate C-acetyltransferase